MSDRTVVLLGAGGFGFLIGWYVYMINRYRKSEVQMSDVVTLVGVLGGAGITALFPAGTALFGAYGIGLALGFVTYFVLLLLMVGVSSNFTVDWFLDGRRKAPAQGEIIPPGSAETMRPMGEGGGGGPKV